MRTPPPPPFKWPPHTLSDAKFLAAHRVGLTEAADRLGFPSRNAFVKWLERSPARRQVLHQLRAYDYLPIGPQRRRPTLESEQAS